jgi:chromosome segregation ATPase
LATDSHAELRRLLDEAHRQLLDRDNAYRFWEDELRRRDNELRSRDDHINGLDEQIDGLKKQINDLRAELVAVQDWAQELERSIKEMEATRIWRAGLFLRSLKDGARRIVRRA